MKIGELKKLRDDIESVFYLRSINVLDDMMSHQMFNEVLMVYRLPPFTKEEYAMVLGSRRNRR